MASLGWIVLLPLIGAVANGFLLRRAPKSLNHGVGAGVMGLAFLVAAQEFWRFIQGGGGAQVYQIFDWIRAGSFVAPLEFVWDPLSALMVMVITGIGFLIHVYAGGYMHHEATTYRFFAYLNLFVFMMLLLVLGNNLLVMFVGWEGVGLCSYLLIGYWYESDENAAAGMKAFLVNRIGDMGFLIGIFLTYKVFGTISFDTLRQIVTAGSPLDDPELVLVGLLTLALFVGATGKSAQIPLYVWLPDAMAGPTPVSALIHAATMVTAGVYMMTRLSFLFYLAPATMQLVAAVGAATALFAASIALVQTDIKKVLAYSTVSQLGYMVMACGVGAFGAGVFHLLTHACFKALLFLGAGSVIYAMHHKQDMMEMGGLRRHLPITHAVMLVGVLAIIGFPGLSGFFSKDEILWKAFIGGGPVLWGVGALAAGCTAFYMVRLLALTFYGPNRSDKHTREHLHETPPVMWAPLVILAVLSAIVGYLGVPPILGGGNIFEHYLAPAILIPAQAEGTWAFLHAEHSHSLEYSLMGASVALALCCGGLAWVLYRQGPSPGLARVASRLEGVYTMLKHKYWVDELYAGAFVRPLHDMAVFAHRILDVRFIDGLVNGLAYGMAIIGGIASFRISGSVQRYGMLFILGFVSLLTLVWV